jgi:hypothetical protein
MEARMVETPFQSVKDNRVKGKAGIRPDEIRGAALIANVNGPKKLMMFALNTGVLPEFLSNQLGTAGTLPSPETFEVTGVKFSLVAANSKRILFRDFNDIFSQGTFSFKVSSKPMLEGWLYSHIPSNIIVPIDGKPEQTECTNLSAFISLHDKRIGIDTMESFSMEVWINNQLMPATPNDYTGAYGALYMVCQLIGRRSEAVK